MTEKIRIEDIQPHILGCLFKHDTPGQYPIYHRNGGKSAKLYDKAQRRKITLTWIFLYIARLLHKHGVEIDLDTPMMKEFLEKGVLK